MMVHFDEETIAVVVVLRSFVLDRHIGWLIVHIDIVVVLVVLNNGLVIVGLVALVPIIVKFATSRVSTYVFIVGSRGVHR